MLGLLSEVRRHHAENLSYYRGLERGLQSRLDEGSISKEAYAGTVLTLMRGKEKVT